MTRLVTQFTGKQHWWGKLTRLVTHYRQQCSRGKTTDLTSDREQCWWGKLTQLLTQLVGGLLYHRAWLH